ncbi:FACT complex subunit spt16 [Sphaceloma murrayae]|uniref:FACT complex subunit spt16 n=1 Tax=Sphaceloma murrayae TaxID=2082308 RepID=A0A2K1QKW6_9PEZI|nr:FACT complex subunit spt16 [Sphaceloma murrayae]
MSEVQFAKAFLATLDRKPAKLSSDFVSDPRNYPSQSPYILPKPSQPFPSRSTPSSAPSSIPITLRPTKSPFTPLSIPASDPSQTTVLDLKTQYAQHAGLDVAKIKILYQKRPVGDLKTVKDLLPAGAEGEVEFSVMVLGAVGAALGEMRAASPGTSVPDPASGVGGAGVGEKMDVDAGPGSEAASAVAEVEKGGKRVEEELKGEAFWGDLRDFLVQRLKDEKEGERLAGMFRGAVR